MLTDTSFHRRSNPKSLMSAAEVVVHMKQCERGDVIVEFLTKGICQPGEPSHVHPHIGILPFNVGRADMLLVWRTDNVRSFSPKTLRRAVTGCSLGIAAVDLDRLSVVDILCEGVRDGGQVHLVAIRGQLNSVRQTACYIPKKLRRTPSVPPSCHPRQYEFASGLNRRERPHIATDTSFHLGDGNVLLLARNKRPYLIDLRPLGRNVTDHAVMILGTSLPAHQQAKDSAFRYAGKANCRAHQTSFDERRMHRNFLFRTDYVRHNQYDSAFA
jgi:hypothetical protein